MSQASFPVQSRRPVTLVGGGPVPPEMLVWALRDSGALVAADGGAGTALDMGYRPDAVIGDMDSITEVARTALADRLFRVDEQDSTDFEKCLTRIDARMVIALGFLGARLDHTLAALSAAVRLGRRCLFLGPGDCAFAAPREIALDLPVGTRLSLFPLAPVTGRSRGLHWPIEGIEFAPAGPLGTSNRVVGPVQLRFDGPGMVIFLPPGERAAARRALESAAF